MKYKILKIALLVFANSAVGTYLCAGPPTTADVGDPGSFGHAAQFMGDASGFITLAPTCTPAPTPVPPATANDNQCFVLAPGAGEISFDAEDICRIKLPKKATRTIIYPVLTFFHDYTLWNTTGVPQPSALFDYSANLSIESDALLDPSIIDPHTGDPANGKLVMAFTPNRVLDDRSMNDGDRAHVRLTFTRSGNAGINKAQLVASGLSQTVVDNLFASAMTIRMNVTGRARLVTVASITGNMRLFGD